MPRQLPVFPLGTVLLPYELLPLHIFEQRYRALMADLLAGPARPEKGDPPEAPEMGIVLIERGHEVGGGDVRAPFGTVARIVRAERFPDGRWFIVAAGSHPFRVVEWLPDDPYPLAVVEDQPEDAWTEGSITEFDRIADRAERLRTAESEVRRAVALASELGDPRAIPELSDDPVVALWQLAGAIPVGAFDRQRLLAAGTAEERLTLMVELAREAASMLAFRLGQG